MPNSSVTITSPVPNNGLVHVLSQTVDARGEPVGNPVSIAILDDGQSITTHVGPNTVILQVYAPRNAVPATPPTTAPTEPDQPETLDDIKVIGSATDQPAPIPAPAPEAAPEPVPAAA